MKKVWVGTLHSGEGDFDKCVESIKRQKDVSITHHVISNLPEKEAHNALWSAWKENKSSHDVFVKVDADTVLKHDRVLSTICELMVGDVTGIQCPIHDFISNDLINGLNCFSPQVEFKATVDKLFCDRVDSGHKIVLRSEKLPSTLVPAALHCHYSSELHAFHYGLHRKLKNQTGLLQKVKDAWIASPERIRGFALLGASVAHAFKDGGFNYTDDRLMTEFLSVKDNYDDLTEKL